MRLAFLILLVAFNLQAAGWTATSIDHNTPRGADGVQALDLTGDGKVELLVSWQERDKVMLYIQGANPYTAWTSNTISTVNGPEDAKFGDVDADGNIDVMVAADDGQTLQIVFNPGTASNPWITSMDLPMPVGVANGWLQIALADINNDGRPDIIGGPTRETLVNSYLAWWECPAANKRTGANWIYHEIAKCSWTMTMEVSDFNGDGLLDILVSDRTDDAGSDYTLQGLRWLSRTTVDGAWTSRFIWDTENNDNEPMFSTLLLTNSACVKTIVTPVWNHATSNMIIFSTSSDPNFLTWTNTKLTLFDLPQIKQLAVDDINGDNIPDFVANNAIKNQDNISTNAPNVWYLLGPKYLASSLGVIQSYVRSMKSDNVLLVDLDADGYKDVILTDENDDPFGQAVGGGLMWYRNPGVW